MSTSCIDRDLSEFDPSVFFDEQKIKNTKLYKRRNGRRQDHGTRGNSCNKGDNRRFGELDYCGKDQDARLYADRKTLLRDGSFEDSERSGSTREIAKKVIHPTYSVMF